MDLLIYMALIGLAAGIVKGVSGFGSSLVAIALLSFLMDIDQDVVVMMLSFNVLLNALLLVENKGFHPTSLRNVWVMTVFGVVFTFIGLNVLQILEPRVIEYIAGTLIIIAVLNKAFNLRINMHENYVAQAIVGTFSGLGNGVASIDGPPVVFYLTSINAEKIKFKNILAAHFLVMGIVGVILAFVEGLYNVTILKDTAFISVFAVIGLFIGMLISRRLNEKTFQWVVMVILMLLAIKLFI